MCFRVWMVYFWPGPRASWVILLIVYLDGDSTEVVPPTNGCFQYSGDGCAFRIISLLLGSHVDLVSLPLSAVAPDNGVASCFGVGLRSVCVH